MSLFLQTKKALKIYKMYPPAVFLRCDPQRGLSVFLSGDILVNVCGILSARRHKSYFLKLLISPLCTLTMYDSPSHVPPFSLSLFLSLNLARAALNGFP